MPEGLQVFDAASMDYFSSPSSGVVHAPSGSSLAMPGYYMTPQPAEATISAGDDDAHGYYVEEDETPAVVNSEVISSDNTQDFDDDVEKVGCYM